VLSQGDITSLLVNFVSGLVGWVIYLLYSRLIHIGYNVRLFYVLSIFIIGLCISYDDPSLLDAAYSDLNSAVKVAPFTKIFQMANLPGADHAVNAVLLTSVLSAGNSCFLRLY
jgi:amino acid permease